MKTYTLILLVIVALISAACGSVSDRTEAVAPWSKPYLYVNDITLTEESIQKPGVWEGSVTYPVIAGLRNRNVQNTINRQFRDYAVRFAEKNTAWDTGTQPYYRHSHWYPAANYNNVLCIRLYSFEQLKENSRHSTETFLFDLNTGRRLGLEDLFVKGTDFVDVISNAIKEDILRQNFDEEYLYRPFDRIEKTQPFVLTDSALVIDLPANNPYVAGGAPLSFTIPLAKLGASLDIFGKFLQGRALYENQSGKKHMLPGRVAVHVKSMEKEGPGYYLRATYAQLANTPNIELQEQLNQRFAQEAAVFINDAEFIKEAERLYQEDSSRSVHKTKHVGVTANFANILCINDYQVVWRPWSDQAEETRRVYLYDTVSGRPLALKDLFVDGSDFQSVIDAHIRQNIEEFQLQLPRPFTGVSESAKFYLEGQNLIIYSLYDDVSGQLFIIPFEKFGDLLVFYR